MGCRDDYIGLMAGIPRIADDLLQRQKSAALGHEQKSCLLKKASSVCGLLEAG
jgi:hypothetical protein